MAKPERFIQPLSGAMLFVTILNATFALLGFMLFSDDTCSNIVMNLQVWALSPSLSAISLLLPLEQPADLPFFNTT
jgi:hypothetical protein